MTISGAPRRQIEEGEGGGDEARSLLPRTAQQAVQAVEDGRRLLLLLDQDGERRLDHRHPQAGREPVTGNVGDHDRQATLIDAQDVEVVAADRGAGLEMSGELHLRRFLQSFGKEALLDLRAIWSSFSSVSFCALVAIRSSRLAAISLNDAWSAPI